MFFFVEKSIYSYRNTIRTSSTQLLLKDVIKEKYSLQKELKTAQRSLVKLWGV